MSHEQCLKDYNSLKNRNLEKSLQIQRNYSRPLSPKRHRPDSPDAEDVKSSHLPEGDLSYGDDLSQDDVCDGQDCWEEVKEDGTISLFQALFDDIEDLPKSTPKSEKRSVVVLVNCPPILKEIGSDVRMMHRQVVRLINKRVSECMTHFYSQLAPGFGIETQSETEAFLSEPWL